MEFYELSFRQVLDKFSVNEQKGLYNTTVHLKHNKYGRNLLENKKSKNFFAKFLDQFKDFMIIILLIAAGISFLTSFLRGTHDYLDCYIILFIVLMNSLTGVIQESKAEKAIDALKKMSSPKSRVIRGGEEKSISSEELVPGDILCLNAGDLVSADARLIEDYKLLIDEASLTGESTLIKKSADLILTHGTPLAERKNMVYSSSIVNSGRARAVVTATGMKTEVGKIAGLINQQKSKDTPLQEKLAKTGKLLGLIVVAICIVIFVLGVIQHVPAVEMFMIAISLAVAAIPEGLPAVVTIVLALGVRRMVQSKAIIRKLPAVETLGSANVICVDKTGTLTQNKMAVTKVVYKEELEFGSLQAEKILTLCALCNNATVSSKGISGEPTEAALLDSLSKTSKNRIELNQEFPRVLEFPFDSKRKMMTTVHKLKNGRYRVITKGAPDVLLTYSTNSADGDSLGATDKRKILAQNERMASQALRVIAVGCKEVETLPKTQTEAERELCFCGLVGMIDPPRPEVKEAVKKCKKAGIKPIMITGDHVLTAQSIARDLGILDEKTKSMTGEELERTSDEKLAENINKYSVFARVTPQHKVRIVKAFRANKSVVAMTGDGVNDAPALKAADIGCAMGKTGTEVAKNAADMILTDDNFSTIVEAVRQGRGIFANIKKTVHFLLSSNIGEIIAVLTAFLLKLPSPLLAIQLLWVNLVTDSLPALALGVDPIEKDIMERKPVDPQRNLLDRRMWQNIALEGVFIGSICLLAFTIGKVFFDTTLAPIIGRTMAFSVLSISEMVHAFNVRSERSLFKIGVFGNLKLIFAFLIGLILQVVVVSLPQFTAIFRTSVLNSTQWIIVMLLSLSPLVLVEIEKFCYKNVKIENC